MDYPLSFIIFNKYYSYFLCLASPETESFFLPFALLDEITFLPLAVDILSLNPCLFFLLRFEG